MEKDGNLVKELDYTLRDLISLIKSQVDYLAISGLEDMDVDGRDEYFRRLQKNISNLYESINENIVVKSKKIQELLRINTQVQIELEKERNELKLRNNTIEQDIIFARNIQRQIIPTKSDDPQLGLLYKPMEQLGGDFFDIFHFHEPERIGFFMSDVSGHGIPASLVTTIIKSLLTQMKHAIGSPEYVLSYMNQILFNFIAGNFVTCFLGELNLNNGSFVFSNAGHNPPLIIGEDGMQPLSSKKSGVPLAVMKNEELERMRKKYADELFEMPKGSKLFIYTDGLTEAYPVNSDPSKGMLDFGSAHLERVVMKYRRLPAQEFVEKMYWELETFRGSSDFDDDICMICFDYV